MWVKQVLTINGMHKFLGKKVIAQCYTHSQNFDCHDFFPFRSLQCSLVDTSKFLWQEKRNKQTIRKYLLLLRDFPRIMIKKNRCFILNVTIFKFRTELVIYKGGRVIELA